MADKKNRYYDKNKSVVFKKTNEKYGGLSNMSSNFPIILDNEVIRSSEALYQACKFPSVPKIQKIIFEQKSPMTAKMTTKPYSIQTREDWNYVRVNIMRWCLRVKLACNWLDFSEVLISTTGFPIVEQSHKDNFWGAISDNNNNLTGQNILGRLLMELREQYINDPSSLKIINPPNITNFFILKKSVSKVYADEKTRSPQQFEISDLNF